MSTTLEQSQYGFDRASRRTWQKRPLTTTQDQQYNYDALSQVAAAARGSLNLNATAISGIPANAESWDYDPTGNWRGYHSAAAGATPLDQYRVHDRGNRLTQIEDNPHNMILDRAGRMLQMAPDASGDWDGKLDLMWDAWSRITRVKNTGATVGEYGYDGTHRRTARVVDSTTLHSYYNDAWRPVEERKDDDTTACTSYLWGARHRDDLVRRDRAVDDTTFNETRYILMDYFNPSAITDETGVVKERYAFSAFGLRTIMNADYTMRSDSECGMEFAFQGQFLDGECGLMNYGYRYYSPPLGRWTCKDPIGIEGGLNIYRMIGNSPLDSIDHLGLAITGGNKIKVERRYQKPESVIPSIPRIDPGWSGTRYDGSVFCFCGKEYQVGRKESPRKRCDMTCQVEVTVDVRLSRAEADRFGISLVKIFGHEQKHIADRLRLVEDNVSKKLEAMGGGYQSLDDCNKATDKISADWTDILKKQFPSPYDHVSRHANNASEEMNMPKSGKGYSPLTGTPKETIDNIK